MTELLAFLHDYRWQPGKEQAVRLHEQEAFLAMYLRKQQRQLNGRQERKSKFGLFCLIAMLVIIYGTAASSTESTDELFTLTAWQVFSIGMWALLSVIVTSIFSQTRFIELLKWVVIYWPLLAILTSLLFTGNHKIFESDTWVWITFLLAEVVTVSVWLSIFMFSPALIASNFFTKHIGAGSFWDIHLVADWTMTYRESIITCWTPRRTCKYEGQVNDKGLPHGTGRWSDDSYYGEVLTGEWKDGAPAAPFLSRQYGTGDTFRAVSIAYFMATDDDFDSTKLSPTNDSAPRCGVASVECSVQGSFYSNFPLATPVFGPCTVGEEASLADCLGRVLRLETENDIETAVSIFTGGPWGLQVQGHVYEPTGLAFTKDADQVVVDVVLDENDGKSSRLSKNSRFMPLGSMSARNEKIFVSSASFETCVPDKEDDSPLENNKCEESGYNHRQSSNCFSHLEVRNWTKTSQRDALIYIPGFNSCMKHSLECLGQFLAMTKLSSEVYPVCFAYPSGQVLSYRLASAASATKRNRDLFLEMIQGLRAAGIQNIHLMSHSLGVQTLLGVFEDEIDGSRSAVSKCLRLDSDFDEGLAEDDSLLRCKSVTMLNPDFPLDAFVDHAFKSVRRICSHITVVGDRGDQALFYSSMINGIYTWLGYEHPRVLTNWSKVESSKGFKFVPILGRCIDSVCTAVPKGDKEATEPLEESLLFREVPPVVLSSQSDLDHKVWLDVDVIDTTSLDTNIQNLRHSAFNVNPILLKDLEELVLTGRRASKRSTLLYREGNVFSYCHAPAFVTL